MELLHGRKIIFSKSIVTDLGNRQVAEQIVIYLLRHRPSFETSVKLHVTAVVVDPAICSC
jgi:hypothetical protein